MQDTSLEFVSENGPISINEMMQEGVKALNNILSNQIQGNINDLSSEDRRITVDTQRSQRTATQLPVLNKSDSRISTNDVRRNIALRRGSADIDEVSHRELDEEEAEIIFDYETEDFVDAPDAIGERISQMIESVLPNGFAADSHGKLRAMVNDEGMKISEKIQDFSDQEKVDSFRNQFDDLDKLSSNEETVPDSGKFSSEHSSSCPQHQCNHNASNGHKAKASKKRFENMRNHNYNNYEYDASRKGHMPDFSVLVDEHKPMCMFCEYYMVFGEPPKNMIKWYNRTYGYNRLPHGPNNRKRNR